MDHPANQMALDSMVHINYFDMLRLTVNPFTLRKVLLFLPSEPWTEEENRILSGELRRPFYRGDSAFLDIGLNPLAASYPSRLALFVHFKSCLRYHGSVDIGTARPTPKTPPPKHLLDGFEHPKNRRDKPSILGQNAKVPGSSGYQDLQNRLRSQANNPRQQAGHQRQPNLTMVNDWAALLPAEACAFEDWAGKTVCLAGCANLLFAISMLIDRCHLS